VPFWAAINVVARVNFRRAYLAGLHGRGVRQFLEHPDLAVAAGGERRPVLARSAVQDPETDVPRRGNLVTSRKEGSTVYYSLTSAHVAELLAVARQILTGVLSGEPRHPACHQLRRVIRPGR
jgi:hypothetical protein